jgi:hypothetical protein
MLIGPGIAPMTGGGPELVGDHALAAVDRGARLVRCGVRDRSAWVPALPFAAQAVRPGATARPAAMCNVSEVWF